MFNIPAPLNILCLCLQRTGMSFGTDHIEFDSAVLFREMVVQMSSDRATNKGHHVSGAEPQNSAHVPAHFRWSEYHLKL